VTSHPTPELDERFMDAAIRFARRHLGVAWPNPSVGALVVRHDADGPKVVGRGVTARGGRPHAERQALAEAGEAARGATLYVTLEPCAHHGRTPPCAEAVLEHGIARVVTAMEDPDSRVAGKGHALLRRNGVEVVLGVGREAADRAMAGYFTRMRRGRPRVTLKLAVSADGMIGRADTPRLPITGAEVRDYVHVLRAETDAVAVGVSTALVDDPELTVRLPGMETTSPVRVVFDSRARLPLASKLVASAGVVPVVAVVSEAAPRARVEALREAGVEVLAVPAAPDGHLDLLQALTSLSWKGFGSLLVEGGSALGEAFMARDLVDEIVLVTSGTPVGEGGVRAPASIARLMAGWDDRFDCIARRPIGPDRLVRFRRRGR
jgi:diaminohydroxyphosphoribosylaminopyrimidine deaminase/5-amino-6-(5-phosphoribosylamino)uracil reductase